MLKPIELVANAMVGETGLPYVPLPLKGSARIEGETAFDQLYDALQRTVRTKQQMNMIRHDHEVMKIEVGRVTLKYIEQPNSPAFIAKKSPSLCRLKGDEVSLAALAKGFSLGTRCGLRDGK